MVVIRRVAQIYQILTVQWIVLIIIWTKVQMLKVVKHSVVDFVQKYITNDHRLHRKFFK